MACSTNISKLKKLAIEKDSCIKVLNDTDLALNVWPMYTNDIKAGVVASLNEILGGYKKR